MNTLIKTISAVLIILTFLAYFPTKVSALDTGFKVTGTVEVNTGWADMTTTRINTSDDSKAACDAICDNTDDAQLSDFTFGIPAGATIDGIEVAIEAAELISTGSIGMPVSLSWDDGSTFTTAETETVDGTTDATYTSGGAANTWGRTWDDSELANGAFRVRIDKSLSTDSLAIDKVEVKVYYTEAGAGAGPVNVKTYNGLATASVKTINGTAIASIKSYNGLQ